MKPLFAAWLATFSQFWSERQPRERRYLITAALFSVATLIYLIGIDPALTGREELRKALPGLHQQTLEIQQMAQELATMPDTKNRREVSREVVEAVLSAQGLQAQTLSVNSGMVHVQLSKATMAGLQTCLLSLQKSNGLFVDEIKITGLEEGMISATFTLRQFTV
jgi:general secretion pathway protein M